MSDRWANRISGEGVEAPDQLLANPKNWRVHPKNQQDAMAAMLDTVGWVQRVIVNRTTGHVVDGHLRVALAISRKEPEVPVLYVDLNPDEEALVLAALDPLAGMAATDEDMLRELTADLTLDSPALVDLLGLGGDAPVVQDEAPEPPSEPVTKAGDLWVLRDHRLLCGDASDTTVVTAVMDGGKAECVWTDPPYGVAIGDKNRYLNSIAPSNRVEENLEGDTLDEDGLLALLRAAFAGAATASFAGAAWYVDAPAGPLHLLTGQALNELGIWHQTIQWVKNNATFSPMGVDYHWQAEPIFYGWVPGAAHRYYGGRKQTTVWEIDRPRASPEHPTMKPVELVARALENSTQPGDVVLDPFAGSGTTLVAAEQLGRVGRAVEVDPAYCDVIIERWQNLTGEEAKRA